MACAVLCRGDPFRRTERDSAGSIRVLRLSFWGLGGKGFIFVLCMVLFLYAIGNITEIF